MYKLQRIPLYTLIAVAVMLMTYTINSVDHTRSHCCCKVGPQGPKGPIGPQGVTGPIGPTFVSSYADLYSTVSQSIGTTETVSFENTGTINGITYDPTDDTITVPNTGTYSITYYLTYSIPASTQLLVIFGLGVNGSLSVVPSTIYASNVYNAALTVQNAVISGSCILPLTAGDNITLTNLSPAPPVALNSIGLGTITASINIEQIA